MFKLPTILVTAFLSVAAAVCVAQYTEPQIWTPNDIITTKYVRNLRFSEDGKALVWTQRKAVKEKDKFVSDIYLTRLDLPSDKGFRTFQLTNKKESDHDAIFSKNGEEVYFLSSREKGKKIWKLSLMGGEAGEVHSFDATVRQLGWKDKRTLLFLSNDGKTLYDEDHNKDNTQVVEDSIHWKITRLYAFNVETKYLQRLTNNQHPITSYTVSRDGRYVVVRLKMSPHDGADGQPKPRYYLYNLQNGDSLRILTGYQQPSGLTFTASGQGFYFSAITSSDPEWEGAGISELYYFSLLDKKITKVTLPSSRGMSRSVLVVGEDALVTLANGITSRIVYLHRNGTKWQSYNVDFTSMNNHVRLLAISPDGKQLAFSYSTASILPKYYLGQLTIRKKNASLSGMKEFTVLNKNLSKKTITRSEVFSWKGYNEEPVDGILYYPENYKDGKKYPLVLSIHGGPAGADQDAWSERWSTYPQIFAQRGAFVLKPNYHGSSNYGQGFVESIKGHYYDLEEQDLVKAIEALDQQGKIDMDRLGIMGWSNGAILTTMMIQRHPDMFKVAASGAGDVNWTSDYGTCSFGVTFDQSYFGGAPWDDKEGKPYNEAYILKSPLFEIEKIKTPTIIFHGSEDRSVPRDQGWEYYRGLQQVGKAPVRFLWFPGQPHGLQKITHQTRKMNEELAWFDQWLFHTYTPKNEVYKPDSPLDLKLSLEASARHNEAYGVWENEHLVPEMVAVAKDSFSISRFEITNAQYKSIIPSFNYPRGEENYPVRNLKEEQIHSYIDELNKITGQTFRLPNEQEAKSLNKTIWTSKNDENTLNHWAGYPITKDEAGILRKKLHELKGSLIQEVGRFKPIKFMDSPVYDLVGNVAEYYQSDEGLKYYGYSAYDYVDPSDRRSSAQPDHTGMRVVKNADRE